MRRSTIPVDVSSRFCFLFLNQCKQRRKRMGDDERGMENTKTHLQQLTPIVIIVNAR